MRIVRFVSDGSEPSYGLAEGDSILPLRDAPWRTNGAPVQSGESVARRNVALLAPVQPTKILCVGKNYRAHAAELQSEVPPEPLLFLKPPSSLLRHQGTVLLPPESSRVDHEGELGVVIGKRCRRVPARSWREVVAGLTCGLDITARDLQRKDGQWSRAKGFDTFCPLGPAVETDVDPTDLLLQTHVDGELRQSARTSLMVFDVGTLIAHFSAVMTLEPGDVILTGTPEGVGPLAPGQTVSVSIEKVGRLEVRVAKEG